MTSLATKLYHDEAGFIVSAELVLISTILVLGLVVGLSEIANGVNEELEDVASAIGAVNQSYRFSGLKGHKGNIVGSRFKDVEDFCDSQFDITCDSGAVPEGHKFGGFGFGGQGFGG